MEYESAFMIDDTKSIAAKLKILVRSKCIVSICYGDEDATFDTTLHEINVIDNALIFYHSPIESEIANLLNSDTLTFKANHLGIQVAFEANRVDTYMDHGLSVFSISIPNKLLWIEAREYFRIKGLDLLSGYCHLFVGNNPKAFKIKLFDISIAGFSVLIDDPELSILMMPETCIEQCKIELEQVGDGLVSFEVKNKTLLNPDASGTIEKIGCKFTKITPAFEDIIYRYMTKVERESRQR